MRHRRKLKKLNRDTKHRQALFKNQLRQLATHGSIVTTEAKAKQLKRLMDKVIYRAKTNSVARRRSLHRLFGDRRLVNRLVDQIAALYPQDQTGGFTSITRLGHRRGDNALLVRLALTQTITTQKSSPTPSSVKTKIQTSSATRSTTKHSSAGSVSQASTSGSSAKKTAKSSVKNKKSAKKRSAQAEAR